MKERTLDFTPVMIVRPVAFEDLVEPFKQERPEVTQRAIIAYEVGRVRRIVMIGRMTSAPYSYGPGMGLNQCTAVTISVSRMDGVPR